MLQDLLHAIRDGWHFFRRDYVRRRRLRAYHADLHIPF